jgi:hypothetical protein
VLAVLWVCSNCGDRGRTGNSTAAVSTAWLVLAVRRGGEGPARPGRSSGPLLRRHTCWLVTAGLMATCLGVGDGLGKTRGPCGMDATGGPLDAVRPAGERREGG